MLIGNFAQQLYHTADSVIVGHPVSIFTSLLVSWSLGMVISIIVFALGRWKKKMHQSFQELQ